MAHFRHGHAGNTYPNWYLSQSLEISRDSGQQVRWGNKEWMRVSWLNVNVFRVEDPIPGENLGPNCKLYGFYTQDASRPALFVPIVSHRELEVHPPDAVGSGEDLKAGFLGSFPQLPGSKLAVPSRSSTLAMTLKKPGSSRKRFLPWAPELGNSDSWVFCSVDGANVVNGPGTKKLAAAFGSPLLTGEAEEDAPLINAVLTVDETGDTPIARLLFYIAHRDQIDMSDFLGELAGVAHGGDEGNSGGIGSAKRVLKLENRVNDLEAEVAMLRQELLDATAAGAASSSSSSTSSSSLSAGQIVQLLIDHPGALARLGYALENSGENFMDDETASRGTSTFEPMGRR